MNIAGQNPVFFEPPMPTLYLFKLVGGWYWGASL